MVDKIKILDQEYSFSLHTFEELDECWGRASPMKGWIKIAKECGKDQFNATLLHEVVHCIAEINDLEKLTDLKETTISVLAAGIYSFIKSNPELVRSMIDPD